MGLAAVGRHISLDRRSGAKCPIDFSAPPAAAMLHPVSPLVSIAMAGIDSGTLREDFQWENQLF